MAITKQAEGTWAVVSAASQTVTIPSGVAAGDLLLLLVTWKGTNLPNTSSVTSTQGGWNRVNTYNNGTTASGNGTGSNMVEVWAKEHSGTEGNPTIHFEFDDSMVATPAAAVIIAFRKDTGYNWVLPLSGSGGGTTSTVTSYSQASVSDPGVTAGDVCVAVLGSRDDTAWTVPTFTQTGITWGTATVCPATPVASTTSNDISATAVYRTASSGTSSAAPTVTGTLAAAETAAHMFVRIRQEVAATPKSGSDSGTGADTAASLTAAISGTDAGSGADASSLSASLSSSDAGVGSDTGTVLVPVSASDAAVGSDTASLAAAFASSDAGSGSDAYASEAGQIPGAEAGSGSDLSSLSAALSGSDQGAGTDTSALTVLKTASDAGVGVEVGGGGSPTTVGQDDFNYAAGNLAGKTADVGGTWSALTGTPLVTGSAVGQGGSTAGSGYLGGVAVGDGDVYGTVTGDRGFHNYQSVGQSTGIMARVSSGGPHAYVVTAVGAVEDGYYLLYLWRITSGAATLIYTLEPISVSQGWRIRLQVEGSSPTTIRVRLWQDGTSEPGTWNISTSDNTASNQMASGSVGVYSGTGYSSGEYMAVDDFLVVTAGAGGVAGQVTAAIPGSDAGTGAESVSSRAYLTSDAGSGTDTGSLAASLSVSDAGTGTDGNAVVDVGPETKTATDAGTGTDTASLAVSLSLTDQGSGSDGSSLAAAFGLTESSTAAESAAATVSVTGTDAGVGQETGTLAAGISPVESGAGADTSALAVLLGRTDAATGSDTASVSSPVAVSESGTGAEAAALAALLSLSESGVAVESATVDYGTTVITSSDAGVGADSSTLVVSLSRTDAALGADAASLSALYGVSESPVAADLAVLAALLSSSDAGIGTDHTWRPPKPGAIPMIDSGVLGATLSAAATLSGSLSDGARTSGRSSDRSRIEGSPSDQSRSGVTVTDG